MLILALTGGGLALAGVILMLRHRRHHDADGSSSRETIDVGDPGRERRAEQRARRALRDVLTDEEWEMFRELGFVRVWGTSTYGPVQGGTRATRAGAPYAYLIYPHRPAVSYLPQTRELLGEFSIAGPDLPQDRGCEASDVLATWLALTADEDAAIADAGFNLLGRQLDPVQVSRDLHRLRQWEQARLRRLDRERARPAN